MSDAAVSGATVVFTTDAGGFRELTFPIRFTAFTNSPWTHNTGAYAGNIRAHAHIHTRKYREWVALRKPDLNIFAIYCQQLQLDFPLKRRVRRQHATSPLQMRQERDGSACRIYTHTEGERERKRTRTRTYVQVNRSSSVRNTQAHKPSRLIPPSVRSPHNLSERSRVLGSWSRNKLIDQKAEPV